MVSNENMINKRQELNRIKMLELIIKITRYRLKFTISLETVTSARRTIQYNWYCAWMIKLKTTILFSILQTTTIRLGFLHTRNKNALTKSTGPRPLRKSIRKAVKIGPGSFCGAPPRYTSAGALVLQTVARARYKLARARYCLWWQLWFLVFQLVLACTSFLAPSTTSVGDHGCI